MCSTLIGGATLRYSNLPVATATQMLRYATVLRFPSWCLRAWQINDDGHSRLGVARRIDPDWTGLPSSFGDDGDRIARAAAIH